MESQAEEKQSKPSICEKTSGRHVSCFQPSFITVLKPVTGVAVICPGLNLKIHCQSTRCAVQKIFKDWVFSLNPFFHFLFPRPAINFVRVKHGIEPFQHAHTNHPAFRTD